MKWLSRDWWSICLLFSCGWSVGCSTAPEVPDSGESFIGLFDDDLISVSFKVHYMSVEERKSTTFMSAQTIFNFRSTAIRREHDGHEYTGLRVVGTETLKDWHVEVLASHDEQRGMYLVMVDTTIPLVVMSRRSRTDDSEREGANERNEDCTKKILQPGKHSFELSVSDQLRKSQEESGE